MIGTLFNAFAVAAGSTIGLLCKKYISHKNQTKILIVFGLFTVALSVDMITGMREPIDVFLALVLGTLLGQTLSLHDRLTKFTARFDKMPSGKPDRNKLNEPSLGTGFIKATLLFCVGGLTLIGCMEEGLSGKSHLLFIKGTMDLISSFFLSAVLGKGVLFSALGVLLLQGGKYIHS